MRNHSTFHILHSKLHKIGLDEIVDFTVHDTIDVRGLVVGTVVLDTTVVEDVGAYLTAPLDLLLASLDLGLSLEALLHGTVVELGAQQGHRTLLVLGLVTRLRVLDEDFFLLARIGVGIPIAQTDTRLHLVDVLTTGTAGTEGVPLDRR